MADNIAIVTGPGSSFGVSKTGTSIVPFAKILNFTESAAATVTIVNGGDGLTNININSSTALQNHFGTIAVIGQSDVVADSITDTLTFTSGTAIDLELVTNPTTDTITINNIDFFGTQFQQATDDTVSSTTSTAFINKLTMTTPSLPSGTYRVGWYSELNSTAANYSTSVRIQLNATTTIGERIQEAQDTRDIHNFGGYVFLTLSGINSFNLDYAKVGGGAGNASIRRSRIEIWRIT